MYKLVLESQYKIIILAFSFTNVKKCQVLKIVLLLLIIWYIINSRRVISMLFPSIDSLLTQVGSKYLLVNVVSKRAKDMKDTSHYQMKDDEYKSDKNIGKALEEIANNMIDVKKH